MSDTYRSRQQVIQLAFVAASMILVGKALQLQIVDTSYRSDAEATAIGRNIIFPARGVIYDRNDSLMVFNKPIYDLMVNYNQVSPEMDTAKFCRLLGISNENYQDYLEKDWKNPMYSKSIPYTFLSKLSLNTFAAFQESMYEFPGFFVKLRSARGYNHKNAANVLGYIREVNREEVEQSKKNSEKVDEGYLYIPGDYIGDSGLEKQYEDTLRGRKGIELVLKDNLGREVGKYNNGDLNKDSQAGKDLYTSIDLRLQKYAEKLMQNKRGGIVALEPETGEVLVLLSTPSFDPNSLAMSEKRSEAFLALSRDPNLPFFDRAVMAEYPPGSLFKPLVGLVALQEGVTQPDRTIGCQAGYYLQGKRLTACHGHPVCRNIESAIQHSCNAYFVTIFRDIIDQKGIYNPAKGLDIFNNYLAEFGLGSALGIDFPREQQGNFPDSDYFTNTVYKNDPSGGWRSIWIRSLGIGQGELLLTSLQMANLAATIANRGFYKTPHIVKAISDGYGRKKKLTWFDTKRTVSIDQQHYTPIIRGMELAVEAGTARSAYIPGIPFCGKTGTAENNQRNKADHSIFFGFAPKDNPRIAIAVFIENAGFGGTYAAPIASLVVEQYLQKDILGANRKWLEKRMLDAVLTETPDETLATN